MFSYENRNLVSCFFCEYQFFTDGSTGENLDLDNCSPLCPTCGRAEDKELENSENIVDKDKTRRIIDKDKTKFAVHGSVAKARVSILPGRYEQL